MMATLSLLSKPETQRSLAFLLAFSREAATPRRRLDPAAAQST